jgi:hypothetical protein
MAEAATSKAKQPRVRRGSVASGPVNMAKVKPRADGTSVEGWDFVSEQALAQEYVMASRDSFSVM